MFLANIDHIENGFSMSLTPTFSQGKYVTFDIGGDASTTQMAEQISNLAKSNLRK